MRHVRSGWRRFHWNHLSKKRIELADGLIADQEGTDDQYCRDADDETGCNICKPLLAAFSCLQFIVDGIDFLAQDTFADFFFEILQTLFQTRAEKFRGELFGIPEIRVDSRLGTGLCMESVQFISRRFALANAPTASFGLVTSWRYIQLYDAFRSGVADIVEHRSGGAEAGDRKCAIDFVAGELRIAKDFLGRGRQAGSVMGLSGDEVAVHATYIFQRQCPDFLHDNRKTGMSGEGTL